MQDTYEMAYTEVLEIIKYLPQEEYKKIPKEKIEFYKKNKDNNYKYRFDVLKPLNEQNISRKTNAIIVSLFRDYFATPKQKEKLEIILQQNEEKYQEELRIKYNPDNIFKKNIDIKQEEQHEEKKNEVMLMVIEKLNIFKKIVYKIKNFFAR